MFGAARDWMLRGMPGVSASMMELTPAQRQFAEDHGAVSVMPAESSPSLVFVYAREPLRMHRWLIDAGGRILDLATFRNSPR
jgi:hypothetical protein